MSRKDDNLKQYEAYNATLRAWLVGYGFGVPALFILNEEAQGRLLAAPNAGYYIVRLFLIGAAAQILMAFVNKTIAWCAYYVHDDVEKKRAGKCATWIASFEYAFGIDVFFDLVSLSTFAVSIVLIARLFI